MDTSTTNDYSKVVAKDKANVWHHLSQHKKYETMDPIVMLEGKGMYVWDTNGKRYLDAVSGAVWTVNVGFGRTRIADAVRDQLAKLNFFASLMGTIPGAEFADALIDKMPGMSRVYYATSGSEANEKAFKMVRQIAHLKYGGKKNKILYRERDYHGSTISTLSASGQPQRRAMFEPYTPGFVQIPHCCEYRSQYGDCDDYGARSVEEVEKIILREGADTIGAMILEPVTAGGGVLTPPEGYWEGIQALCKKYDILLHIDEVVCGMGRTGKWFGYQHYGIKPDIVTIAKGLASGYAAISCTVTTEEVFEMFKAPMDDKMSYFRDISTFGGCAGGPAAALENMKIIEEENLLDNVTKMSVYLMDRLNEIKDKHEIVGDVRGKGLFCGLELVTDRETKEPVDESVIQAILADCFANGVIIGSTNRSMEGYNNIICLSPALICTEKELDEITGAIDAAIGRL